MKVMYKDGITRHVSDAESARLKASGYVEVLSEKENKTDPKQENKKAKSATEAKE